MTALFDYLEGAADQQVDLLRTLVSIDSGTDDKAGVDRVGAILAGALRELGLDVTTVAQQQLGDHVVARKRGTAGKTALLVGHLDTVFAHGTAAERPFRIENGRAYGPGVYDMRGGLTVLLFALRALHAVEPETWRSLDLHVILNSDEEPGSDSSRELIADAARRASLACILEPARAGGEYVCARKGVSRYVVRIKGIAAHSGNQPQLGASAISELAAKISAVDALNGVEEGLTVNVGVVRGGTRVNMVPDAAECEVEMRLPTVAALRRVEAAIADLSRPLAVPRTQTEITGGLKQHPMEARPDQEPWWDLLGDVGNEVGFRVARIATGAASDGNTTARFTPTIDGMGPVGDFAHSPNEYIVVSSLRERTKTLARFLERWLATDLPAAGGLGRAE